MHEWNHRRERLRGEFDLDFLRQSQHSFSRTIRTARICTSRLCCTMHLRRQKEQFSMIEQFEIPIPVLPTKGKTTLPTNNQTAISRYNATPSTTNTVRVGGGRGYVADSTTISSRYNMRTETSNQEGTNTRQPTMIDTAENRTLVRGKLRKRNDEFQLSYYFGDRPHRP